MKVTFQIEYNPACISAVKLFILLLSMGLRLKFKKIELQSRQIPIKDFKIKYTMDEIKDLVCLDAGITENQFNYPTRKREIVDARQKAMFLSKKLTNKSLTTIGEYCGDKDHTTVLHACKTVKNLASTNYIYKENLKKLLFDITKTNDIQIDTLLK